MKKLTLLTFFLLTVYALHAQVNEKEYLQQILNNLERIESASYYTLEETWQPGDSIPLFANRVFIKEYNNPKDTAIGASFVAFNPDEMNKMDFCYDGSARAISYHNDKVVVVDDFTARPLPFRPLAPPFFNYAKNIIKYTLQTKDSIAFELKDLGDRYLFILVINEDTQVEFFGKAYHMPKTPFYIEPTSIYEIWLDKSNGLPYKIRREMSHDTSAATCSEVELNKLSMNEFKASDYYPEGYEIKKYQYGKRVVSQASELTGKQAPEWTLNDSDGSPVSLASQKSKVLLINFTGIGCGACQAAVPFLKELKNKFKREELELIAIESWSQKESAIKIYADNKKLNYTILNATKEVVEDYKTGNAAPFFFIVDEQRVVRKVIQGYRNEKTDKEIIKAINELL